MPFRGARASPVFWLLAGQLIMFVGIAAIFPIAPLYVRRHGGNAVAVALFIAGPLLANTLVQVPAGRLTDRVGRRPVLIGARLLYAAVSIALFADLGPLWLLASLRALQGASSGAYVPALRAALVDLSGPERRAEAFSKLQACEMVGLLVGPFLGGVAALWRDSAVFGVAGVATLAGLLALWRLPETGSPARPGDTPRAPALRWWRQPGILVPCLGLGALGTVFSMYDVVWPLYLDHRGYGSVVIGVTISVFAIPILLLARPGGRLADRANRRVLMVVSFCVVAACCSLYPFLRAIGPILLLGSLEACAFVLIEPTMFAIIGDSSPPHQRGRTMGIGGLFEFGGSALGAAVLGSLYGVAEGIPFRGAAAVLVGAGVLCALTLPARPPARPSRSRTEAPVMAPLET